MVSTCHGLKLTFIDNQHIDDDKSFWELPFYSEKGAMLDEKTPWITRSTPGANQKHIISGLKYGADIPIALLKIFPQTTIHLMSDNEYANFKAAGFINLTYNSDWAWEDGI